MKYVTDKLLKDLGVTIQDPEEFKLPENVINMPFKTFHFGNKALQVHINNLIIEFGAEAVVDELIRRIKT